MGGRADHEHLKKEQALAIFHHAGGRNPLFKGQQWLVTNYVLLAYAALAAAPLSVAKWVSWASVLCAVLALGTAGAAGRILWGLDKAHDKELDRMDAARAQLPLVSKSMPSGWGAAPPRTAAPAGSFRSCTRR